LLDEATQQQRLEHGIRAVFKAGAVTMHVLGPTSSDALVRAALEGDAGARAILSAADRLLRQIHRRPQPRALPCWVCGGSLWRDEPPAAIAVLVPYGIEPRVAVGMAICSCCAADRSERELGLQAVSKLRDEMLPDLRVLPAMAEAGHA
jgi:hypothetical protein